MKNYDIKSATAELSLNQKIVLNGKRLAFLVPNMFNRIGKGFNGKVKALKEKVNSEEVQNVYQEAVASVEDNKEVKIANIEEKIEKKEEAIVQVKANENIPDNTKSYIIKAYENDIDRLREKTLRVSASPRRLLISGIFLKKLISNRKAKISQYFADKKMEKELNNIPEVEEQETVSSVEDAKEKYLELNNKRLELTSQIKKIQEEMMNLVNEYGLTKDMFEETMGKSK